MARIIIPAEAVRFFEYGEWANTANGEPYVERAVQGATKKGPYWHGRAQLSGAWYAVTAGATTTGRAPTEWDLDEPDVLVEALKEKKVQAEK